MISSFSNCEMKSFNFSWKVCFKIIPSNSSGILKQKNRQKHWKGLLSYFITIIGMQCATSNHSMRQIWRMRHRLATPALNPECRSAYPNRAISATTVRPRGQNVPKKMGEARPAGYTHGKAAQKSTKDQVV